MKKKKKIIKIQLERNKILKEQNDILTTIDKTIFDGCDSIKGSLWKILGNCHVGKAVENLACLGISSSDFMGIEEKLDGIINAIEETQNKK